MVTVKFSVYNYSLNKSKSAETVSVQAFLLKY